jgi:uncharacterized protein
MTQPAKGQEPSMDEILASIRRIIADENPTRSPGLPAAAELPNLEQSSAPASPRMAPPPAAAAVPPHAPLPEPLMPPEAEINAMIAQLQATSARQAPADAAASDADILELTEQQIAPAPAFGGQPDVPFEEAAAPSASTRAAEEQRRASWETQRGLVSAATSAAVDSAFNTLAQTVLVQNARTLEDLVREMLRPMLKAWLDDNLPSLVERLVRAEIERVARGRG